MSSTVGQDDGRGWAAVARKDAAVEPKLDIQSLLSTAGLKTLVVDANALIGGGVKLDGIADQFFTIREVLAEVRDPASRFHLATLPVTIRCLEPSEEALAAVTKFARATGDLHSLSPVDLKLIALTYTLEVQVNGAAHIRSRPPALVVKSSSTVQQRDPPGWGIVDNIGEWEGIDEESSELAKTNSRILGLKILDLHINEDFVEPPASEGPVTDLRDNGAASDSVDVASASRDGSQLPAVVAEEDRGLKEKARGKLGRAKASQNQLPNLEGKLNVAQGVDASKGAVDENGDDWQRASSRSTRRNFLKRESKRAARRQAAISVVGELSYSMGDEGACDSVATTASQERTEYAQSSTTGCDSFMFASQEDVLKGATWSGNEELVYTEPGDLNHEEDIRLMEDGAESSGDADCNQEGALSTQTDGFQSGLSDPLWKSSVACMTSDYAMQNVLLQMGLRLLSITGMHIYELNKWVLKCQACNHVTSDVRRIFCNKCGNGGTLFKVAVTVGQNGTVHSERIRRVNLRGTRYSLPMPKGGREGAAQNPILREDQLPSKILHPKVKNDSGLDDFYMKDVIFTVAQQKSSQDLTGLKNATAIFCGRRNPNERGGVRKH